MLGSNALVKETVVVEPDEHVAKVPEIAGVEAVVPAVVGWTAVVNGMHKAVVLAVPFAPLV